MNSKKFFWICQFKKKLTSNSIFTKTYTKVQYHISEQHCSLILVYGFSISIPLVSIVTTLYNQMSHNVNVLQYTSTKCKIMVISSSKLHLP